MANNKRKLIDLVLIVVVLAIINITLYFDFEIDIGSWYTNIEILPVVVAVVIAIIMVKRFGLHYYFGRRYLLIGLVLGWPFLLKFAHDFKMLPLMWRQVAFRPMLLITMGTAALVAITEETVYRGTVQQLLGRVFGHKWWQRTLTVLFAALIFGLIHLTNITAATANWQEVIDGAFFAFGSGVLLSTIYELTGNLTVVVILHFLTDVITVPASVLTRPFTRLIGIRIDWTAYIADYWMISGAVVLSVIYATLFWFKQRRKV